MRRKKHSWRQIVVLSCTDKQAQAAHDPSTGTNSMLTDDRVLGAWVQCATCETRWDDPDRPAWCQGEPVRPVYDYAPVAN